jgi:hypothetical protein
MAPKQSRINHTAQRSMRLRPETVADLETIREHIGCDSLTDAVRYAARFAAREVARKNLGKSGKTG